MQSYVWEITAISATAPTTAQSSLTQFKPAFPTRVGGQSIADPLVVGDRSGQTTGGSLLNRLMDLASSTLEVTVSQITGEITVIDATVTGGQGPVLICSPVLPLPFGDL